MSIFEEHRDRYYEETLMRELTDAIVECRQVDAYRFRRYAMGRWNSKLQRLNRWVRKTLLGQCFPSNDEFSFRVNDIARRMEQGRYGFSRDK